MCIKTSSIGHECLTRAAIPRPSTALNPPSAFPPPLTLLSQNPLIQVHFTNDAGASGLVDDSAVRLYISHTPRAHVAGVLQLGDPTVAQRGTVLPQGLSMVSSLLSAC